MRRTRRRGRSIRRMLKNPSTDTLLLVAGVAAAGVVGWKLVKGSWPWQLGPSATSSPSAPSSPADLPSAGPSGAKLMPL